VCSDFRRGGRWRKSVTGVVLSSCRCARVCVYRYGNGRGSVVLTTDY